MGSINYGQWTTFDILKFSMAARLRGHKQRKLHDHVYLFLLGLTIKLNFNISKVPYYVEGLTWDPSCTVVGCK